MDQRDFIGFSFNGVHSSTLGIFHVSDGDRYSENLQPEFEDRRTAIVGRDGEYYYGSDFNSKTIEIKIAFDHVTEKQFRQITHLFSTKKPSKLIFDERPWKEYLVKIASPITLEYICFDEEKIEVEKSGRDGVRRIHENGESIPEKVYPYIYTGKKKRIYKGEGTIEFICSTPFARAPFKTLDDYEKTNSILSNAISTWSNIEEWQEASGILTKEVYDLWQIDRCIQIDDGFKYIVYNPGDINTPFYLYIPFNSDDKIIGLNNQFAVAAPNGIMIFDNIKRKDDKDTGIVINTFNHLIEGVKFDGTQNKNGVLSWSTTGNLYNEYLVKGDFPKIIHYGPYSLVNNLQEKIQEIKVICDTAQMELDKVRLYYDYLYY